MSHWIEVTSGLEWDRLIKTRVVLEAPNTTRYRNLFRSLKAGDFVLHYLTTALTSSRERQSTIVAVSEIASEPEVLEKKIMTRCKNTKVLPKPISHSRLREIRRVGKTRHVVADGYVEVSYPDIPNGF